MATTIDSFKRAFAGQEAGDDLKAHDRGFSNVLKRLNQSIDAARGAGAADGFQSVRDKLVERYRDVRQQTDRSAKAIGKQLEVVRRQMEAVIARIEAIPTVAGNGWEVAAEPSGLGARGPYDVMEEPQQPVLQQDDDPVGVAIEVTDAETQQPIKGYTVVIGDEQPATDVDAMIVFDPGTYDYRVSAPGYTDATGTVEITETREATLYLKLQPEVDRTVGVFIDVEDAETEQPVKGFTVVIGDEPAVTDVDAVFVSESGTYDYRVSAPGYTDATGTVEISETRDATLYLKLQPEVDRAVGVAIGVTDAETEQPIEGFTVVIGDEPAVTDVDLFFVSEPGTYDYRVSAPGYTDATGTVEITETRDATLYLKLQPQSDTSGDVVPPGGNPKHKTLEFSVQGGGGLLANATVTIANQVEVTDSGGYARFLLAPGVYEYQVSADGFQDLTGYVDVSVTSDVEEHGVVLDPADAPRADVVLHVIDAQTKQPIEGALAWFDNDLEPTDSNGQARFIGIPCGTDPYRYGGQDPRLRGVCGCSLPQGGGAADDRIAAGRKPNRRGRSPSHQRVQRR